MNKYPNFIGMFANGEDFERKVLDHWSKDFSAEECANELDYEGYNDCEKLDRLVDLMYELLTIQQEIEFNKLLKK